MMRRSLVPGLLVLIAAVTVPMTGCGSKASLWPERPGPKVVVTFAPYKCFVENVLGDKGTVQSLLSSQGPHHADVNISTRNLVEEADILFANGLDLDDLFAKKLKESSSNGNLKLVNLGASLDERNLIEGRCSCTDHGDPGHPHDHEEGFDPHIWLSPKLAISLVEKIRDELKAIAPQYAEDYDRNAAAYIGELQKLYDEGRALLAEREDRKIVTVHESLGYFAQSYRLKIAGVIQKSPGQDPNPTQLADLISTCKKEKVRVIAVEPQYSSRGTVNVLRDELAKAGVTDPVIIELDTLETAPLAELTKDWYITRMKKNLSELDRVLK